MLVLRRARILQFFLDVFDGDQTFQVEVLIHDQQLLDAVLLQDAFGFFQRRAHGYSHEIVFRHHRADQLRVIFFKAKVTVGQDSRQPGAARHRQTGNLVLVHDFQRLAQCDVRRNRHRIDDHAAFRALYPVHFLALAVDGHVAVHHSDAALPGDGDGQPRFRHCVHGCRCQRNIHRQLARELRGGIHVGRQYGRPPRQEQHVVKRKTFGNSTVHHSSLTQEH